MKIKCILHADFETPGVIEAWGASQGHLLKLYKPYQGQNCLDEEPYDILIIMGGPQSPLNLEEAPYLKDEIILIKKALSQNKLILGFCLGAQLIGEALGAKTQRSPEKEIGVFPLTLTLKGQQDPLFTGFPSTFPVIHWHNDMPGLTKDAQLLAFSEGCPQQIIRYAARVYGFQCHLEISLQGIEDMIKACPGDLAPSKFTQSPEILRRQNYTEINANMIQILNRFVKL